MNIERRIQMQAPGFAKNLNTLAARAEPVGPRSVAQPGGFIA
jgi:hypothetical protein